MLAPVLLAHASLTEPLVRLATHLIADLGLAGVALLTLSSGVIGVPGTEPTMLFAGFDVFQGHLSLAGIIVAGVIGDILGASIAYAIGFFGSQELLERQGSKLHVKPGSIQRAHRWFDRYGTPVIFVSRLLPFIRAAFPYAAGVARMSYWRLLLMATRVVAAAPGGASSARGFRAGRPRRFRHFRPLFVLLRGDPWLDRPHQQPRRRDGADRRRRRLHDLSAVDAPALFERTTFGSRLGAGAARRSPAAGARR